MGVLQGIDVIHGRKSTLDITQKVRKSESLDRKCEWNVSKQSTMGSDHYPLWCKIGVDIIQTSVERISRWKLNAANWELFKELCHNNMCEKGEYIEDIEKLSKKISEVLRNTAEAEYIRQNIYGSSSIYS